MSRLHPGLFVRTVAEVQAFGSDPPCSPRLAAALEPVARQPASDLFVPLPGPRFEIDVHLAVERGLPIALPPTAAAAAAGKIPLQGDACAGIPHLSLYAFLPPVFHAFRHPPEE